MIYDRVRRCKDSLSFLEFPILQCSHSMLDILLKREPKQKI